MTVPHEALAHIAQKLNELDHHEQACGLLPLAEQDRTWAERTSELWVRVHALGYQPWPSMDMLAAIGAHVTAYMLALDGAELARVETGEPT